MRSYKFNLYLKYLKRTDKKLEENLEIAGGIYNKLFERIKLLQSRLSRNKKGSYNHEKFQKKLAKKYEWLNNQRKKILNKLSKYYVDKYDCMIVENLNIKTSIGKWNTMKHKTTCVSKR